jgi:hypothetical protein
VLWKSTGIAGPFKILDSKACPETCRRGQVGEQDLNIEPRRLNLASWGVKLEGFESFEVLECYSIDRIPQLALRGRAAWNPSVAKSGALRGSKVQCSMFSVQRPHPPLNFEPLYLHFEEYVCS